VPQLQVVVSVQVLRPPVLMGNTSKQYVLKTHLVKYVVRKTLFKKRRKQMLELTPELISKAFLYLTNKNSTLPPELEMLDLETWKEINYLLVQLESEKLQSTIN
jgi:hypothetical protein